MLVYDDERVDFLVVNEMTESSFVKICVASGALRYTTLVVASFFILNFDFLSGQGPVMRLRKIL